MPFLQTFLFFMSQILFVHATLQDESTGPQFWQYPIVDHVMFVHHLLLPLSQTLASHIGQLVSRWLHLEQYCESDPDFNRLFSHHFLFPVSQTFPVHVGQLLSLFPQLLQYPSETNIPLLHHFFALTSHAPWVHG